MFALVFVGIGVILGVAGIIAGLVPHYSAGVNCGSVFAPTDVTDTTMLGAVNQGLCNYTMGSAVAPVVTLFVLAGVSLVLAVVIAVVKKTQSQQVPPVQAPAVQES